MLKASDILQTLSTSASGGKCSAGVVEAIVIKIIVITELRIRIRKHEFSTIITYCDDSDDRKMRRTALLMPALHST